MKDTPTIIQNGKQLDVQIGNNRVTYIYPSGYLSGEAVDAIWDDMGRKTPPEQRLPKPMVLSLTEENVKPLDQRIRLDSALSFADHLQNHRENFDRQVFLVNIQQGHWTAMSIRNTPERKAEVIYLDSMGTGNEKLPDFITHSLESVYGPGNHEQVKIPHHQQQQGTMCGMHACLNAVCLIEIQTEIQNTNPTKALKTLMKGDQTSHQNAGKFIYEYGKNIFRRHAEKEHNRPVDRAILTDINRHREELAIIGTNFAETLQGIVLNTAEGFVDSQLLKGCLQDVHARLDSRATLEEFTAAVTFLARSDIRNPDLLEERSKKAFQDVFSIPSLDSTSDIVDAYQQRREHLLEAIKDTATLYNVLSESNVLTEQNPPLPNAPYDYEESKEDMSPPPRHPRSALKKPTPTTSTPKQVRFTPDTKEDITDYIPMSPLSPRQLDFEEEEEDNPHRKFATLVEKVSSPLTAAILDNTIRHGLEHGSLRSLHPQLYANLHQGNRQPEDGVYTGLGLEAHFTEEDGVKGFKIDDVKAGSALERSRDQIKGCIIQSYSVTLPNGKKHSCPITKDEDFIAFRAAALEFGKLELTIFNPATKEFSTTTPIPCSTFISKVGQGKFRFTETIQKTEALDTLPMQTGNDSFTRRIEQDRLRRETSMTPIIPIR